MVMKTRQWLKYGSHAFLVVFLFCAPLSLLHAEEAKLLRVEGENEVKEFSRNDLETLPQTSFKTTTIWTEGETTFSGPSLMDILATVGLDGQSVVAVAVNDYKTVISADLIEDSFPILATRRDGEAFGRREKGPLWIVFPFDQSEDFQSELVFSSSVWQLTELRAVED